MKTWQTSVLRALFALLISIAGLGCTADGDLDGTSLGSENEPDQNEDRPPETDPQDCDACYASYERCVQGDDNVPGEDGTDDNTTGEDGQQTDDACRDELGQCLNACAPSCEQTCEAEYAECASNCSLETAERCEVARDECLNACADCDRGDDQPPGSNDQDDGSTDPDNDQQP